MKKKWFRTMELVDDEFIEEANPNRQVTSLRKKRIVTTLVASAACLALTFAGLWLFLPFNNEPPSIEHHKKNDYYAVIQRLNPLKREESQYNNNFEIIEDVVEDALMGGVKGDAMNGAPSAGTPSEMPDGGSTYEEITDNQVEGITEADRIKRSTTHIFYLDGTVLRVFNIAGLESEEVGNIDLSKNYDPFFRQWEFYLSADCKTATVLTQYAKGDQTYVAVISVDVSDPTKPTEKKRVELVGSYLSSRVTDGKLLLLTEFVFSRNKMDFDKEETFLPQINGESIPADCIVLPEEVNTTRYTVVMKLDESTLETEGQMAYLSYTEDVYVSQDHIFLTSVFADVQQGPKDDLRIRNSMTEISCLRYRDSFKKHGSAIVRGYVKDQWSMDEYEGILRVVTTTNATTVVEQQIGNYTSADRLVTATGQSNASLYCIDLKNFKIIASVEDFAPTGEEVRSVRFDKTTAYVCTAIEVTDPVYFFDLSDLKNITYKDTGNIDGFSTSLINMGNGYLLGIGQENWSTFKVEIYKETENGVKGFCKYTLDNVGYSQDYKSYYVDRENQLIGLGITDYGRNNFNTRYLLLHFDGYELREVLNESFSGNNDVKRGVYIDGFMYLFGENNFKVFDIKTGETSKPTDKREIETIYDMTKLDNISCDTAMELFWVDEEYTYYYFSCIKSKYIKVVYQDGTSEDIVSALKAGNATIADLDSFQIEYYVKPHK